MTAVHNIAPITNTTREALARLLEQDPALAELLERAVDAAQSEYNADYGDLDSEERAALCAQVLDDLLDAFGRGGQLVTSEL